MTTEAEKNTAEVVEQQSTIMEDSRNESSEQSTEMVEGRNEVEDNSTKMEDGRKEVEDNSTKKVEGRKEVEDESTKKVEGRKAKVESKKKVEKTLPKPNPNFGKRNEKTEPYSFRANFGFKIKPADLPIYNDFLPNIFPDGIPAYDSDRTFFNALLEGVMADREMIKHFKEELEIKLEESEENFRRATDLQLQLDNSEQLKPWDELKEAKELMELIPDDFKAEDLQGSIEKLILELAARKITIQELSNKDTEVTQDEGGIFIPLNDAQAYVLKKYAEVNKKDEQDLIKGTFFSYVKEGAKDFFKRIRRSKIDEIEKHYKQKI